jgi:hypothetical protein
MRQPSVKRVVMPVALLAASPLADILRDRFGLAEPAKLLQRHGLALQLIKYDQFIGVGVAGQPSRPAASSLYLIAPELAVLIAEPTGPACSL